MSTSPTQRSLALLREEGWTVAIVEHWNPHARRRVDLFGAFDLVAIRAGSVGSLGVQTTSGSNASHRIAKLAALPVLAVWLAAGNAIEVHGWAKRGGRGEKKVWTCRRVVMTVADLAMEEAS